MSFTQSQLDSIEAAYAQGALRVKYADKEVIYRSKSEMLEIINQMKQALNPTKTRVSRVYPTVSKGLT